MTDEPPMEELSFESRGKDFALVRVNQHGERTEIVLSEANVTFLGLVVQRQIRQILAGYSTDAMKAQGVETMPFVPVERLRIAPELSQDSVLLTMVDEYGNETRYALPLRISAPLGPKMTELSLEIATAMKARQVQ